MHELEREERVALAARRGLGDGGVVERERLAQERVGVRGAERRDVDALAVELGQSAIEERRRRRIGLHGLGPRRGHEEQTELGRVAVERQQALERRRRGVVEVVHPQQDRALLADALQGAADDQPAQLGAIEREALARRAHRLAAERRGADPLRRRGDPGLLFLVVGGDLPHVHQHLLDDVALGALEAVVLGDRADDAVERRGDLPVAGAEGTMIPRSWTSSQSHSARRLLPTPASPVSRTKRCPPVSATSAAISREAAALGVAGDEGARAQAEQAGGGDLRRLRAEGVGRRRREVGRHDAARPAQRQRRGGGVARGRELAPRAPRLGGELVAVPGPLGHEAHHELRDLGGTPGARLGSGTGALLCCCKSSSLVPT